MQLRKQHGMFNMGLAIPLIFILLSLFGLWYQHLRIPVLEVDDYQQVQQQFKHCGRGCVVFFDLDDTLVQPRSPLFQTPVLLHPAMSSLLAQGVKNDPENFERRFNSEIVFQQPMIYTEPEVPLRIAQLKRQGAAVYALTNMLTGAYGKIPNMADWRVQQLQPLGLSFYHGPFRFHSLYVSPVVSALQPAYKQGMIMTNHQQKGRVMESFIKSHLQAKPERILFVDDLQENIVSVKKMCKRLQLPCYLLHYRHAKIMNHKINLVAAKQQMLAILHQHHLSVR